jgi:hypothetical protein
VCSGKIRGVVVVVVVVDIGEIVDHHCLNFLFIANIYCSLE